MNIEDINKDDIFEVDPLLAINEEQLSIHAMNSFINHDSASRSYMFSSHFGQPVVLDNGEERIVQSGIEKKFGGNTFSKKIENDSRIIAVTTRYNGIDKSSVNNTVEITIVFEDLVTDEIDVLIIPNYFSLHQFFGFKYKWDMDKLNNLVTNTIIPAGTILADSPAVKDNDGYAFGMNLNILKTVMPEGSEDSAIISKSAAEKMTYKMYETIVVEYGNEMYPLNLYGEIDGVYKPFPEIGDKVRSDGMIMALREVDADTAPLTTSKLDVTQPDTSFDKCTYAKRGDGIITDIKVYYNPKFKKEVYAGTNDITDKYINSLVKYHSDILSIYNRIKSDHYAKYKNHDYRFSSRFTALIMESLVMASPDNKRIKKSYKTEELDLYRVELTVRYDDKLSIGSKITDMSGGKGVIGQIVEDHLMPVDKYGNRAEIVMDSNATPARMNLARSYIQYFSGTSREVKRLTIEELKVIQANKGLKNILEALESLNLEETKHLFRHILAVCKIIDNEQYQAYSTLTNIKDIKEVLHETITKEFYIYHKVTNKKNSYAIVNELRNSIYRPPIEDIILNRDGELIPSKNKMLIAPLYMFLISKTSDGYLSAASSKTNHYDLPVGISKVDKSRVPFRRTPTKILSETETRLYGSFTPDERFLIELKDRASSPETHKVAYKNILTAPKPTNIDILIDRSVVPYGNDSALKLTESILNAAGLGLEYSPDKDL